MAFTPLTRPTGRAFCHRCSFACCRPLSVASARLPARRLLRCWLLCSGWCQSPEGVLVPVARNAACRRVCVPCSRAYLDSTAPGSLARLPWIELLRVVAFTRAVARRASSTHPEFLEAIHAVDLVLHLHVFIGRHLSRRRPV
jgi:hypothetical protein